MGDAVISQALVLQAIGYDIILTRADKNPGLVADWPTHIWDRAEFTRVLKQYPDASLAIRLGEFIDVEIDAQDDTERQKLEDEFLSKSLPAITPSWRSKRGRHWLFKLTEKQRSALLELNAPSKVVAEGFEFRLGLKPAQSLLPTPGSDYRTWVLPPSECGVADLPNDVWKCLHSKVFSQLQPTKEPTNVERTELRPGDIFNTKGPSWTDILEPAGWKLFADRGDVLQWTRPGKSTGLSATSGYCGTDSRPDTFYIFSTDDAISPFEAGKTYTRFEAWATLNYGGDFSAAAAGACRQGYAVDENPGGSEFLDDIDFPEGENKLIQESDPILRSIYTTQDKLVKKFDRAPEPDDLVYDFVLGEYVKKLIPYTEAYPPAILFQLMEVTGILAGRKTYYAHGDYKFRLNGGCIVIGESGVSRKGTGLYYARLPFNDHTLEDDINKLISETDQVSGEGYIQALANRDNHTMLIACEEFAGALKIMKREGSTLSTVIRKALDAKPLGIEARKNPIPEMADAFSSIIGHCTLDEFIENISLEDIRNGLLNRFQFTMSRQNSKISFPESVPEGIKQPVREALGRLITPQEFSPAVIIQMSADAKPLWKDFYEGENEVLSSLRESLGARTPAQVLRSASRIALLEGSNLVDARRLSIALAMQRYAASCIDYIFGDYINDDREEIIHFLESDKNGKTWHDVNEWISRGRKPKRQTKKLIEGMIEGGIVRIAEVKTTVGSGRPAKRLMVRTPQ